MNMRHITATTAIVMLLLSCPVLASVQAYTVMVGQDRLEFIPQPEKGYLIRTTEVRSQETGVRKLYTTSLPTNARPIGGLGRRGLWVVEGEQPRQVTRLDKAQGQQVTYQSPLFSVNGETVAVIPEIVVRVKPGTTIEQVETLCKTAGCSIIKPLEFTTQEFLLEVLGPDAEAVFVGVERLQQAIEVEWAAPNTAFQPRIAGQTVSSNPTTGEPLQIAMMAKDANSPGIFPNDPYFPMQWHLHNTGQSGGTPGADIRAPETWEITTGDPNIIIAVIDCGVDSNHPDLVNNLVPGYDFYENDEETNPAPNIWVDAHGTACAGLVAAQGNNHIGVTGVAYNSKIMPVRDGDAMNFITQTEEATAFRWAAEHGADVFSFSTALNNVPIIHSAVQDVTKLGGIGRNGMGCVALFAAGNWGQPIQAGRTSAYPEVITVGAADHTDQRCWYSSYGPQLDIAAPSGGGVIVPNFIDIEYVEQCLSLSKHLLWTTDILGDVGFSIFNENTNLLDYTEKMSGTSGATPIAAGVAALILSIEPNLTNDEVRHFLERSAKDLGTPGRDDYYGWGRVDARAALDMVLAKRCDLNNDWQVDEQDLAILNAAIDMNDLSADIAPAAKRDGVVDANDLNLLMQYMGRVLPELGLVAHWKLDETEGITAHDSTGWNREGTLQGNPVWQPEGGKIDGALQFDGIDDYVKTPFVLAPAAGAFSVFAWVKGDSPGQTILSQANGADWLLADAPQGRLMTGLSAPAGRFPAKPLISECAITDGQWHRVGLSWDGTNRVLYVDDEEVKRDTQTGLASSSNGLYLGAGKGLESTKYWSGLIDDIRIYDRVVKP